MEIEVSKHINLKFFRVITMVAIIMGFTNLYLLNTEAVEKKVDIDVITEEVEKEYLPVPYNDEIIKYSEMYDLDPYLVAAIIKTESSFNKDISSHMGATGLMQIMPSTGEWIAKNLGIDNFSQGMLQDVDLNIQMGCWYLNYLQKQFKYKNEVLAAYNGGMGNVFNWLNDERYSADGEIIHTIPFKETLVYIEKVEVVYNEYIELYDK